MSAAVGDSGRRGVGLPCLPDQSMPDLVMSLVTLGIGGGWKEMSWYLLLEGIDPRSSLGVGLMSASMISVQVLRCLAEHLGTTAEAQWQEAMLRKRGGNPGAVND